MKDKNNQEQQNHHSLDSQKDHKVNGADTTIPDLGIDFHAHCDDTPTLEDMFYTPQEQSLVEEESSKETPSYERISQEFQKPTKLSEEYKTRLLSSIEEHQNLIADTADSFFQDRLKKLKGLLDLDIDPYAHRVFVSPVTFEELKKKYQSVIRPGDVTSFFYSLSGRIRSIRNKNLFIDFYDATGKMQLFCAQDQLSEATQKLIPLLDQGDWIVAHGVLKKTQKDELSLQVSKIIFLAKCWAPLPEKYEGLIDREKCYRQKHLDWIANERSCQILRLRSLILKTIRQCMDNNHYIEVETPILHQRYGGAAAQPFITHHNALGEDLFLRISPELYLKRIMIGGAVNRVYEMGRSFRNEGLSTRHNPEFTMLEAYAAHQDYDFAISMVETILRTVLENLKKEIVSFNSKAESLLLAFPFCRRPMHDIIKETTGIEVLSLSAQELEEKTQQYIHQYTEKKKIKDVLAWFQDKKRQKFDWLIFLRALIFCCGQKAPRHQVFLKMILQENIFSILFAEKKTAPDNTPKDYSEGSEAITHQDFVLHLFEKSDENALISYEEAVKKTKQSQQKTLEESLAELQEIIEPTGAAILTEQSWGYYCNVLFEHFGEPSLNYPVHVIAYPKDISPLAKTSAYDPRLADRFETFMGMEIANGYSELNDPYQQASCFAQQKKEMDQNEKTDDADYVQALAYGMMPVAGFGIGIDRLIIIILGLPNIRDSILFPLMRQI
jgi:lysyl-tRNA synthetase class 2